jgi:uncharacterized membrane protein YjjP (DUF1212 family)
VHDPEVVRDEGRLHVGHRGCAPPTAVRRAQRGATAARIAGVVAGTALLLLSAGASFAAEPSHAQASGATRAETDVLVAADSTPSPDVVEPPLTEPAPTDPASTDPAPSGTPVEPDPGLSDPGSVPTEVPLDPSPSTSVDPEPSPTAEPTAEPTLLPAPGGPGGVQRPATPPAVSSSTIGVGTVAVALAVLGGAALVVRRLGRSGGRAVRSGGPALELPGPAGDADDGLVATTTPLDPAETNALVMFLIQLGEAMIDSGEPVNHVTETLTAIARVNGAPDADVIVLPTALIVTVPGSDSVRTAVASAGTTRLRLDQIDAVFRVVLVAESGMLGPTEGLARLRAARALDPPFTAWVRVVGYSVLTIGLALVLRAGWTDVLIAAVLGTAVGVLQVAGARFGPTYRVFGPFLNAFVVAAAVFLVAGAVPEMGIYAPLIAPLVTFLPGALLTTSVIDLTTGQMISGAGRLAAGVMQLVLLAFGIVAGGQLVGIPATSVDVAASTPIGPWATWIGVVVFACGVIMHHSARPESAGWIVLVLLVAYAGQVVGGLLLGGVMSAFIGALLMTPVAVFASTRRSGPATLVSFLPAFWLLVPGALGLVGVTQLIGDDRVDGLTSLVTTGATMVAIAFGVLLGLAAGTGAVSRLGRALGDRDPEPTTHAA